MGTYFIIRASRLLHGTVVQILLRVNTVHMIPNRKKYQMFTSIVWNMSIESKRPMDASRSIATSSKGKL